MSDKAIVEMKLDEYHRREAENERLKRELNGAREVLAEYDKLVDALRAENARLNEATTAPAPSSGPYPARSTSTRPLGA